jgi:hypothetical protein
VIRVSNHCGARITVQGRAWGGSRDMTTKKACGRRLVVKNKTSQVLLVSRDLFAFSIAHPLSLR